MIRPTGREHGNCKLCGEYISANNYGFNWLSYDKLFRLRAGVHAWKTHRNRKPLMITRDTVLFTLAVVAENLLNVFALAAWAITYPVWWLHEQLG
jgi:hypothetical protein